MRVVIKGDISGSRNGQPWPARGQEMDLPDDEGAALCASGMADPVAEPVKDKVETRPGKGRAETRSDGE